MKRIARRCRPNRCKPPPPVPYRIASYPIASYLHNHQTSMLPSAASTYADQSRDDIIEEDILEVFDRIDDCSAVEIEAACAESCEAIAFLDNSCRSTDP